MIVDSGLNIGLAVGQDRRIMQGGDAQVEVPPMILPVVLALQSLASMPGQNDKPAGSFFHHREFQLTGAVASAETRICILTKGLWELELSLASRFTAAHVGFGLPTSFTLDYQTNLTMKLLARFGAIGSFTDYNRLRILLESDADLNMVTPDVPAAQFAQIWFTVNAIRIL